MTTQQKKSKLRRELDKKVQEIGKARFPRCLVCGQPTSEMHHYIPKSQSLYLRWDFRNLIPLCRGCHWAHHKKGDPRIAQVILQKKGNDWADELEIDRRKTFKNNLKDLKAKREEIKRGGNEIS